MCHLFLTTVPIEVVGGGLSLSLSFAQSLVEAIGELGLGSKLFLRRMQKK